MSDEVVLFADLLRHFRNRIELTQEELAERADLSPDAVGLLERGERRRPHSDTIARLATALNLSATERTQFEAVARRPAPLIAQVPQPQLPCPPIALVGRGEAIEAVANLFHRSGIRLVTLTGPGGIGKTRLALAVAEQLSDAFADGVIFVSLAALRAPNLVASEIATTVGIRERVGQTTQQRLIQALQQRHILLVLDNFEHLLAAAPLVSDLLAQCTRLAILVTSRIPLRLTGEQQFPVPPLEIPAAWQDMPLAHLGELPAVALFQQRAQAVAPGFTITRANGETVLAICRRLDGLPLAIELAAAWIKLLSPQMLLERLDRRLPLLVGGPYDLPERQRTMHDTIAWSYDLLDDQAQMLLCRLAVFVGGFTLEAAEAVGTLEEEQENAVLAALAVLVDASLVQSVSDAPWTWEERKTPRYMVLETVREFALERLIARGEDKAIQQRHMDYYLHFTEAHAPDLIGAEAVATVAQFEEEHPNVRAALQWALDNDLVTAVRFSVAIWRFWLWHGHLSEGRAWLETALTRTASTPTLPALYATLLHVTGDISRVQTDYAHALDLFTAELTIRRQLSDTQGIARCLHTLGIIADDQGEYARAVELHTEALSLVRQLDDPYSLSFILASLGDALLAQGELAGAEPLYTESLRVARHLKYSWGIGYVLTGLGSLAHVQGNTSQALAYYQESLTLHQQIGNKLGVAACLAGLARLASTQEQPEQVARLLGAAVTLREQVGAPRAPAEAIIDEQASSAARAMLGEDVFMRLWEQGRSMPLAHVVRDLLPLANLADRISKTELQKA